MCLVTGSIWGRPTWGTWWEWGRAADLDAAAVLRLYRLYRACPRRRRAWCDGRVPALFGVAGTVLLPIIRYSVVWWNTLHQGQSIGLTRSTIDPSILWPLWFTLSGFTLFFAGVVLMRMRALLATQKLEARMKRMAAQ
ncbi:MAG: cytochrome c biogenesis protein CcsA [Sphingomonas sp.]